MRLGKRRGYVRYAVEIFRRHAEHNIKIKPNHRVRKVFYGHFVESTIGFLRCTGVELDDGSMSLRTWSSLPPVPSVVDLEGRATATCQVLSYLPLNEEEQKSLDSLPIYFNMSHGVLIISPHNKELKAGRHGFGYQSPTKVSINISTIWARHSIYREGCQCTTN